jgi:hypothetical protein
MKLVSVLTAAAVLSLASPVFSQTVRLEGTGERRKQLDALQLKPFDSALWGELSEWSGTPVTAESTAGKVVLIVTWSGFYKPTHLAVRKAQTMSKQLGEKGLVVVGVHNPSDFAGAAAVAQQLGVTFPYAADAKGDFRSALHVDQDPDFYLIDRAGQMRFADIETESVDAAARQLLDETAEAAGSILGDRAAKEAAAERDRMRIRDVSGRVKPGEAPTVQFEVPDAEVFKAIKWPRLAKSGGASQAYDQVVDSINKDAPQLPFPEEGWPGIKPDTKGKITILYLIEPNRRDMMNVFATMNRVQDVYERDAVVIGWVYPDPQREQNLDDREKAELQQRIERIVKSVRDNRTLNHTLGSGQFDLPMFQQGIPVFGRSIDEQAITMLLTSDGSLRWLGHPGVDTFHTTMKKLIELDPGVQARRKAEDAAAK